jgi:protoporphyrinogen oxidase
VLKVDPFNKNKTIAVVGAGPAGLTAAYTLAKRGFNVDVFEASNQVGGMAKTFNLWEQLVDLGPHRFFSSDTRVNKLWLEVIGSNYKMVNRLTRIYYKNTFFDYPLKAFNALFGLGIFQSFVCILSYAKVKIVPQKNEDTFESWVTNRFGEKLFTIFFKSYSEKLWGIPCNQLDADFAAQRIKKLSLFEAIKAALFHKSGTKHKTLVDEFAYPDQGAGAVYDVMAEKFKSLGGNLQLRTPVASIHPQTSQDTQPSLVLENGERKSYDHIISSMPITILVDKMNAPDEIKSNASKLKFRNTILVYLLIDSSSPFPDQWIYVHSDNLQTGRITNFKNWVPTINKGKQETILCLEYWCYDNDAIWKYGSDQLVELATKEISSTGLIPKNSALDGKVVRVPKCYPVYSTGYRKFLEPVEKYLSAQIGISVIGRYGAFKYNNQDHSILMGLLAADNISENTNHNLWEINTDYEYQESSKITATGLSN